MIITANIRNKERKMSKKGQKKSESIVGPEVMSVHDLADYLRISVHTV